MYPDSDPRSWNYVRKYDRPPLHLGRVLLLCGISCGICALCALAVNRWLGFSWGGSVAAGLAVLAVIAAAESKKIAIWLVKLYQRLAPISVRSMCRFEPSCSAYMILAIEKYGTVRGIRKGITRIVRCGRKDGGFDLP